MKFYIKAKRFSWRDTLLVRDQQNKVQYQIQSELVSFGHKIRITDADGKEAASIEENKVALSPRYTLYQNGEKLAVVKLENNLFEADFDIDGLGWRVTGNILENRFKIKTGLRAVAELNKKRFSFEDEFVLEVAEKADDVPALAVVTAIWALQKEDPDED